MARAERKVTVRISTHWLPVLTVMADLHEALLAAGFLQVKHLGRYWTLSARYERGRGADLVRVSIRPVHNESAAWMITKGRPWDTGYVRTKADIERLIEMLGLSK